MIGPEREQNPGYYGLVISMRSWIDDPEKFRKLNGWLTVVWFVLAFPICVFLSKSLPFIVFISVYAVVTGHLATWQAARVETEQKKELDADFGKMEKKVDEVHEDVVERNGE